MFLCLKEYIITLPDWQVVTCISMSKSCNQAAKANAAGKSSDDMLYNVND